MKLRSIGFSLGNVLDPRKAFYILLGLGILLSFAFIAYSQGHGWIRMVFNTAGYTINDSFMDFFHPINHSYDANPYIAWDRIYPALPYLIYYLISQFIPPEISAMGGGAIRSSVPGQIVFMMYNVLTILAFVLLMMELLEGTKKRKILTTLMLLLTTPFMFQFERANIIFVVLLLMLGFILLKDSPNQWMRELSLILLAAAAVIKIYPVVFGLLLLKEKRYKEILRTIGYGILLFVLPFGVMGGFDQIGVMVSNLLEGINYTADIGFGYKINLSNTLSFLAKSIGIGLPQKVISVFVYGTFLLSTISALILKSNWKTTALLVMLMVGIPSFSFVYGLVFIAIPLVQFLNEKQKANAANYAYAFLFAMCLVPVLFIDDTIISTIGAGAYRYNLNTLLEGMAILLFLVFLNVEGLREAYKQRMKTSVKQK